jgi:hypothetical protein
MLAHSAKKKVFVISGLILAASIKAVVLSCLRLFIGK